MSYLTKKVAFDWVAPRRVDGLFAIISDFSDILLAIINQKAIALMTIIVKAIALNINQIKIIDLINLPAYF